MVRGQEFDLICAFHVVDHLTQPSETLHSLCECLAPGGLVLIVCHDVEAWSAKLLGSLSPIFDVEHVYLFSQETIARLLTICGLEVVEVGSLKNRYPLSYWLRMAPFGKWLDQLTPNSVGRLSIALKAGNLYVLGQKSE